jgi:hypothetical protein
MASVYDAELEAVESALNTLALADNDKSLEKIVARLLPGLLSALSTESAAARAKCIQTLQHINVRLRASPTVALPFDAVLAAAVAPGAAAMTVNVAIQGGYVGRCFSRHPTPHNAFKPLVVAAAAVSSSANRDALLALSLQALRARVQVTSALSNSDAAFRELIGKFDDGSLNAFLTYGLHALQVRTKTPASVSEMLALVRFCVEFVGLQNPVRAVRVFPLLLIAAGDTSRGTVSDAGEDALKFWSNTIRCLFKLSSTCFSTQAPKSPSAV